VQNGTPAPETPVEVQGVGEQTENLFDKDVAVVYNAYITGGGKWYYANDSRSVRIRVKPNTQYTLSTEGTYSIFRIMEIQSDDVPTEQNKYPEMQGIVIVRGEDQSHYTFKTSENAKYIVFQSNLSVVNKWLSELMLVEGDSVRSDYIPYGYKIPVTVSGVNLFDYNWLWTKENVKLNDYFNYITIAMKPNTEYTISNNYRVLKSSERIETALIVVNSETEIITANGGVDRIRTVTTASDGLLRIAYRIQLANVTYQDIVVNRDTLADGTYYIQINEGSSASPYEPYHEPITTSVYVGSEPLHKIGDYADYVDYNRGVVVRRIKKLVLTGEERVTQDGMTNTVNVQLTTISATLQVVCTHFMSTPTIPADAYRFGYAFIRLDLQKLYFGTRLFDDDFKTYLAAQYSAGTPVTVWYVLATPEEEPLENLLPIWTIKGSDVLTTETTVQPSNIWIKGKIKAIN